MRCPERDELEAIIDGATEGAAGAAARLASHIEACRRCRRASDEVEGLDAILAAGLLEQRPRRAAPRARKPLLSRLSEIGPREAERRRARPAPPPEPRRSLAVRTHPSLVTRFAIAAALMLTSAVAIAALTADRSPARRVSATEHLPEVALASPTSRPVGADPRAAARPSTVELGSLPVLAPRGAPTADQGRTSNAADGAAREGVIETSSVRSLPLGAAERPDLPDEVAPAGLDPTRIDPAPSVDDAPAEPPAAPRPETLASARRAMTDGAPLGARLVRGDLRHAPAGVREGARRSSLGRLAIGRVSLGPTDRLRAEGPGAALALADGIEVLLRAGSDARLVGGKRGGPALLVLDEGEALIDVPADVAGAGLLVATRTGEVEARGGRTLFTAESASGRRLEARDGSGPAWTRGIRPRRQAACTATFEGALAAEVDGTPVAGGRDGSGRALAGRPLRPDQGFAARAGLALAPRLLESKGGAELRFACRLDHDALVTLEVAIDHQEPARGARPQGPVERRVIRATLPATLEAGGWRVVAIALDALVTDDGARALEGDQIAGIAVLAGRPGESLRLLLDDVQVFERN